VLFSRTVSELLLNLFSAWGRIIREKMETMETAPICIATTFNQVKKEEALPDVAGDQSKNVESINDYSPLSLTN
jgi:hypothetical protein